MKRICVVIGILILTLWIGCTSYAHDNQPVLIKGYATAYNGPSDTTCTGKKARRGICGGCDAYIGKTIILYQRLPGDVVGKVIGIYECEDTGPGTESFQKGKVIDVWCEDFEACQEFMDRVYEDGAQGRVFIQVEEAKG